LTSPTHSNFDNFIGGRWLPSLGGMTFDDENPARRGSTLGSFQSSTADDVARAIDAATEAFRAWRRTSVTDRQQYVAAFLTLLQDSRDEIARIVTRENGKTIRESRAEVDSALIEGRHHLQQAAGFFGRASAKSTRDLTTWVKLEPVGANYAGEVAERWRYVDGGGEIGVISSVTQAFCSTCNRMRLSTEGSLYTCLFAQSGHDLKSLLRAGASDDEIRNEIAAVWQLRDDRYSEIRTSQTSSAKKVEMSYIGG